MARPLTSLPPAVSRKALAVALCLALMGHALLLPLLARALRPPSLLRQVAPTFYTRTLAPEAPAAIPAAAPPGTSAAAPARPTAIIRRAARPTPPAAAKSARAQPAKPRRRASAAAPASTLAQASLPGAPLPGAPLPPASGPDQGPGRAAGGANQASGAAPANQAPDQPPAADAAPFLAPDPAAADPGHPAPAPGLATDDNALLPALPAADGPAASAAAPASPPPGSAASAANASMAASGAQAGQGNSGTASASPLAASASAAPAAPAAAWAQDPASAPAPGWLDSWPRDTRLRYSLSGNYRGELHGSAEVLWQREGSRYQAIVQLDVGLLLNSRFTSQGLITAQGLRPEVYEEQVRQRRRGVRLDGDSVQLHKGERVPRPPDVQDTASQFVELGHRFATGQITLAPGKHIDFWLARPNHVQAWTYDVIAEETLHLPRLGPVQAFHLKPRPLERPGGSVSAEIWFAPSLQYLPVRIRLSQGEDTHMDLIVQTVEQR